MLSRRVYLTFLLPVAASVGVVLAAVHVFGSTMLPREALSVRIDKLQADVDSLRQALVGRNVRLDDSFLGRSDSNRDLEKRLALVERQLFIMMEERPPNQNPADTPDADRPLADRIEEVVQSGVLPFTAADTFYADSGTSDWAVQSQETIESEFWSAPYFADKAGDLVTQCRKRSCKVEWMAPLDSFDEREESLARLELLAAATRNNAEVSQVHTESRIEGGRLILVAFILR